MFTKKRSGYKILFIFSLVIFLFLLAFKIFLDAIYVPVILKYHSIQDTIEETYGYGKKLIVTKDAFAKQMKFLHDFNYKVISLKEFVEKIKKGERIPRKTVAITFDDGLENNFLNAYPVLKKYNFPAAMFVITNYIGQENFLEANEIKTMSENNITIGSHTMSHWWLPSLDDESIRKELKVSKKVLENITGKSIELLAYPLGAFDERTKKIAKELGYLGAVTTNPKKDVPKNDIYALGRLRISMTADNLFVFWLKTSGSYRFIQNMRDES